MPSTQGTILGAKAIEDGTLHGYDFETASK